MLNVIKEIFSLLSSSQRKKFYALQILVIIMSLTELVGIASIAPFLALVGDKDLLYKEGIYSTLFHLSGLNDPVSFIFIAGIAVLISLTFSSVISMFTTWRISIYASRVGANLANRLYTYYMNQNWEFHANTSSAQLTKQISTESRRISDGLINPLMQMNARIVLSVLIAISIIIYNPIVALVGLLIFLIAYLVLFKLVRKVLSKNGQNLSLTSSQKFRLMNEGFGGIKDVLLLNRNSDFISRFNQQSDIEADAIGINNTLGQVPRYLIELIAYGSMIGLVLFMIKLYNGNLGQILPIIGVYAIACFKLLPAFQNIYYSVTLIKANISAFEEVKEDLKNSQNINKTIIMSDNSNNISFEKSIDLRNITYSYPNKTSIVLNNVSLSIPVNSVIGIVGSSGSGKSTLIDIILGLLMPQKGEIYVDDTLITDNNKRGWQDLLGFVPQSIFLSEGSIAENVAFGIPAHEINYEQVMKAIDLAHLTNLVNDLSEGIHTRVGERGVQLSGGQRQRIGIARALYNEADILIFDEATSALDGITEKIIMDAIHDFTGQKTIIMIAHRLKTVQKCDTIYLMEKGKIIDQGTYDYLVENNSKFREMAKHS